MNQEYELDGTLTTAYKPYYFAQETTYNTSLYMPYQSVLYGLYTQGVPPVSVVNPVDVYYYEQRLNPGWRLGDRPTFPSTSGVPGQSARYQKYASSAVSSRGGSSDGGSRHMYRRLAYT